MPEKPIGRGRLILSQGDITESRADAIVNAANNHLWMGAGVAGAIKKKGGAAIEAEAMAQGPIPVGEAIVTGGGNLAARYVIHAAGMGQDLRTSAEHITACTEASLRRAEEFGISHVAFPAIGTGVGGFSSEAAARCMLSAAARHLASASGTVETVEFVLFSDADLAAFSGVLRDIEAN
ncbi:MAG: macro domain-containing protein [bacterium]|nr:macro domain-containing protein [bacterium]